MMSLPDYFNADTGKAFVVALLTIGGGIVAWKQKVKNDGRRDRIDDAGTNLDVTALSAGDKMIQNLQADIARLRQTMTDAETNWRAQMDKMEARLDEMSKQVDAAIAARRAAEEAAARLRFQLQGLGVQPVA